MKKISIVVVDDHKLIREMWANMFETDIKYEVTGESGTLDEAVEMIKIKRPDVVLLDINLGKDTGMDAVPLIRKYSPGTRIIALSVHSQPVYAKKMLQLGAKAYITKNSSLDEIKQAIDEVMNGGVYVCTEIKDILTDHVMGKDSVEHNTNELSLREIEIIGFIKSGLSSKEISSRINIQIRTVEVHRHNILKKLNFKNTASLINYINNTDLNFN